MNDFVHLHLHTEYSLLDGACRLRNIAAAAKELGQKAVAITDHGVMFGVVDFYKALKKEGIKPIIGCEVYMSQRGMGDKTFELDSGNHHLVLLCKNQEGYNNLIHMVSRSFTEGFYSKPRIDMDILRQHSGGLIALSGCLAGEIPQLLAQNNYKAAREKAQEFLQIFSRDSFYIELQDHGIPEQKLVNQQLARLAQELNIELVATNDVHYLKEKDSAIHDVLLCIQTAKSIDDQDRMRFFGQQFYMKSYDEMNMVLGQYENALANTVKIADMCSFDFDFSKTHLPRFQLPEGEGNALEYLKKLCTAGMEKKYGSTQHMDRLEYELQVISSMGYVDYFLIVSDFVSYAKRSGIAVGPGRGSAAGSMVSYTLDITDIDPIRFNLYFERFLNPERVSMPDIDIDFCYIRRQEVIDYVSKKYGADHLAQIITFGTMAARGAIRDVGRALNMPYGEVDAVAKLVPQELKVTLDKALEVSHELKNIYDSDDNIKRLIDTAKELEGMPRNASTHAAGVVITSKPTDCYVPLAKNDELIVTQYTMGTLEELGLLKMDFLALRNLTILDDAVKMVNQATPGAIDLSHLNYDDQDVYGMIAQGKTAGVFQLESSGMTNVAVGLKPHNLDDVTAIIALFRPGPMQFIPKYIECKHNPEKIQYTHPQLESILSVTYGCIVYQEQVMEIFRKLAGYSLGKADTVRKAISKKKIDILAEERQNFTNGNIELGIAGCAANGVDESTANIIFNQIMDFADYAFPKAHSVSYAVLAYQTAYVKYYFPKEYMAALLTSIINATDKVSEYIYKCKEMGIEILPPHINYSNTFFTVEGENLRFGLAAIRNVGRGFTENIALERTNGGPFKSFDDFCSRMSDYELNKRMVENLIYCGAFDSFGNKRAQLICVYEQLLNNIANGKKKNLAGQLDLFGHSDQEQTLDMPDIPEYTRDYMYRLEKEASGIYLSGHPMGEYTEMVSGLKLEHISQIVAIGDSEGDTPLRDDDVVSVAAVILSSKTKTTKSNNYMAYLTLEDISGTIEALAFGNAIRESGSFMAENNVVLVNGRVSAKEDESPKLIVNNLYPLTKEGIAAFLSRKKGGYSTYKKPAQKPIVVEAPKTLYIRVADEKAQDTRRVMALLKENQGNTSVVIYSRASGKKYNLAADFNVNYCNELAAGLKNILAADDVVLK